MLKVWHVFKASIHIPSFTDDEHFMRSSIRATKSFLLLQRRKCAPSFRAQLQLFSSINNRINTEPKRLFPEELNIIYDSKCNVCKLEMDFLVRRDAEKVNIGAPKLKLTDLEGKTYNENDPANGGVSYREGMSAIHAVTADGKVIRGVPVFALAYDQVKLGWLFKVTTWPLVKQLVEIGYVTFAKYRTYVTRGASIDSLVVAYEQKKSLQKEIEESSCNDNVCKAKSIQN
jgi:predicted DCC family thiol-disulfide oxidoreductase YuxK